MKSRREFITLVGGAAAAWPMVARAQQAERSRRVGMLTGIAENDPQAALRIAAVRDGLRELGWVEGRNIGFDFRFSGGSFERMQAAASELVAAAPDVLIAGGTPAVEALRHKTRTVPLVFASVADPVGAGFVDSLARPGGNATGFTNYEYGISGKWLELLKEIAPGVKRAAVLRDATNASGMGSWGAIQAVAPSLGIELTPVSVGSAAEIERATTAFAAQVDGGLVVTGSNLTTLHRELIITLAAKHLLPAIYPYRFFAIGGGLASYGPDQMDQYRHAVEYVDRVLRGEKPSDLPVQAPRKYELVLNLKTAKALGLTVPPTLLARADEVIE
jgi:putative ABC transport system substrate-binding protein